ncbi:MAG: DUF2062 domain-containing protein [Myxococcota bacterium]|nr:DUF2062 domain-containing protein [Myxococcota bacterium]
MKSPRTKTYTRKRLPRYKAKARRVIRQKVLGVADTPHRIAWGVALGFFIAFTPTLGFQILVYLVFAAILRANKLSGIPWLFLSNPFSAVPVYYSTWWVGNLILTGGKASSEGGRAAVEKLVEATTQVSGSMKQFLSPQYWSMVGDTLIMLGYELWIGGFAVGAATGAIAYPIALKAIKGYRARQEEKRLMFQKRREQNRLLND